MTVLICRLKERKIAFREHVPGSTLTTLRIGGDCPLVIEPQCAGELQTAARLCRDAGVRFDVIGGGSNLLISDKGIPWAVISTRKMQGITCRGGTLRAMCGVPLPLLLQAFAKAGDNSLLFAAGIPGTVGGGLFMNAGTGGHGVLDAVYSVCVLDADTFEFKTIFQKECNGSYRKSVFQAKNDLIVSADFPVRHMCEPEEIFGEIRARLAARKAVQPLEYPNAGSTFKRHDPAVPLSRLLDELGLRGMRLGGAAISEKHAGFLVNLGGATAADVMKLIGKVQDIAERSLGFRPETEIRRLPDRDEFFTDG